MTAEGMQRLLKCCHFPSTAVFKYQSVWLKMPNNLFHNSSKAVVVWGIIRRDAEGNCKYIHAMMELGLLQVTLSPFLPPHHVLERLGPNFKALNPLGPQFLYLGIRNLSGLIMMVQGWGKF